MEAEAGEVQLSADNRSGLTGERLSSLHKCVEKCFELPVVLTVGAEDDYDLGEKICNSVASIIHLADNLVEAG